MSAVRCNCESAVCPGAPGNGDAHRCTEMVVEGTNLVQDIAETCDACFPHYRDAGYAWIAAGNVGAL